MSQEFCVVTRKKWLSRKGLQRRPRRVSEKSYEDFPEVDVGKSIKRLEQLCEQMKSSDYFMQAMSTLEESLETLELADGVKQIQRLVCFGIGPFTRNYQALHQLAFALSLQAHCEIKRAIYFDPVFRESEKEVLQRLQCEVMTNNCEAKYEVDELTLFYLPHCPNCLTNNLLWRNWQPQKLKNIVLINNSFESLISSKPERLLRLDSCYIMDVLAYTKEMPLEDDYGAPNVFNDLAVHVFPLKELPDDESQFWTPLEAPTYKDVEMVSAEDFAKLSLTQQKLIAE